jgi:hypothetical protein
MLNDLDQTLRAILDDAAAPTELRNADVSFETPDKNFAPAQATVNLFLYEVKENRELRDPVPITEIVAGTFVRRTPPLRVTCGYLATGWSNAVGPARVVEEHRLLGQALLWLSRFPTIPAGFLQGALAVQPFPLPTMVAQADGNRSNGEFWSALGMPPRPAFTVTVTIAMDLSLSLQEGPPVSTKEIRLQQIAPAGVMESVFSIGGTVRDAATTAVIAGAGMTLLESGVSTVSDADGRFLFDGLQPGAYTLRAVAPGFATLDTAIVVPGAATDAFDVSLT